MKKYFKKTTSIALISLCGLSLTGLAVAMPDGDNRMKRGHFQLDREYTLSEINTLVEENLLRSRNEDKTLESIVKTDVGTYLVSISNESGEDKSFELNKFGTPVDAPLPGLFKKPGGKFAKSGKFNKGQWDNDGKGRNRYHDMDEGIAHNDRDGMQDRDAMSDEKKQEKREAFIQENALTLEQVTTLAEAKIIRLNNDKLKLGDVVTNDEGGYTVTILSQNNDLISRIKLNEAGFPEFKKKHHRG